jgi:hypothetical protein
MEKPSIRLASAVRAGRLTRLHFLTARWASSEGTTAPHSLQDEPALLSDDLDEAAAAMFLRKT